MYLESNGLSSINEFTALSESQSCSSLALGVTFCSCFWKHYINVFIRNTCITLGTAEFR